MFFDIADISVMAMNKKHMTHYLVTFYRYSSGAQILYAKGRLNFLRWSLNIIGPQ